MLRKLFVAVFLGLLGTMPAQAQQTVISARPVSSQVLSSTIAVSNTFQSIQVAIVPSVGVRQGCTVQNTGSNDMWVYFGPIASATKNAGYRLTPVATGVQGGSIGCATAAGGVLQDQVSITGTMGDTFAATFQY